jgi:hypothetical protein
MYKFTYLLIIVTLSFCAYGEDTILYKQSFDTADGSLPEGWWSEGDQASIKNGSLYVNADQEGYRRSTIWFNRSFEGNLQIEYDVHFVASSDKANNNNFFLLFSDPDDKTIVQTRKQREDGNYPKYHKFNGYIFTHVRNNEDRSRFRFRDCPGFHLLAETFSEKSEFQKTYHITITKIDNRIQYHIDTQTIFDMIDDRQNAVHQKGLIGFRTWHTELWWDNLIVKRIDSK